MFLAKACFADTADWFWRIFAATLLEYRKALKREAVCAALLFETFTSSGCMFLWYLKSFQKAHGEDVRI